MAAFTFNNIDGQEVRVSVDGIAPLVLGEKIEIVYKTTQGVDGAPALLYREARIEVVSEEVLKLEQLYLTQQNVFIEIDGNRIFEGVTSPFDYTEPVQDAPYTVRIICLEEWFIDYTNEINISINPELASCGDTVEPFTALFGNPFADTVANPPFGLLAPIEFKGRFLKDRTLKQLYLDFATAFTAVVYYDYTSAKLRLWCLGYIPNALGAPVPFAALQAVESLDMNIQSGASAVSVVANTQRNFTLVESLQPTFSGETDGLGPFKSCTFAGNYSGKISFKIAFESSNWNQFTGTPQLGFILKRVKNLSTDAWFDVDTNTWEATQVINYFDITEREKTYEILKEVSSQVSYQITIVGINLNNGTNDITLTNLSFSLTHEPDIVERTPEVRPMSQIGNSIDLEHLYVISTEPVFDIGDLDETGTLHAPNTSAITFTGLQNYALNYFQRQFGAPQIFLDGSFIELPIGWLQRPLMPFYYDYRGNDVENVFQIDDTATYDVGNAVLSGRFRQRNGSLNDF